MAYDGSASHGLADGPWLYRYAGVVAILCRLALAVATVFILMDLLLIGAAVVLRYLFSAPIAWSDELVELSLTGIVMLTAPDVLRRNGHISVDILVSRLPARFAPWVTLWSCLSVLFMAGILVFNGWRTVSLSRMIGRLTEGHLELPVWIIQCFLPLGGVLLALVALELIWRSVTQIRHQKQERAAI